MAYGKNARRCLLASISASALILAACGGDDSSSSTKASTASSTATTAAASGSSTASSAASSGSSAAGGNLDALYASCKTEGKVNLIALPDDWANYKGILQAFRDKYPGVENPVVSPDISSQEELDAVTNLKGQKDQPDNIDVSPAKAQVAIDQGLWEPYKPTTWDQIPAGLKDPAGNWVGAYYGIMAFGTNTTIVKTAPKTFADLKDPQYKGKVALNGDPRKAGAAFAAVMAASLANGGSADDIMPGIKFYAELKKSGNLIATQVTPATVLSGETPIAIDWSYNFPSLAKKLQDGGQTTEINFPSDGVYGSYYAQGVIKGSPHQNCAKLWVEHILSDEGALGYLAGGAMPARYAELVKAGKVTAEAKKNLPPDNLVSQVKFLTVAQQDAANKVLADNWGPMVADA